MAIELVTKYSPYVDEIFVKESKIDLLTNKDYDFMGAKGVKVYKITTAEMNDYARNGYEERQSGNWSRYGEVKDLAATTQYMILSKDRSFTFVVDKMDNDETGQALDGAEALARQIRQVVIPEIDTYIYGEMCKGAGVKPEPVVLTAGNIYDEITKATESLDDSEVPETDRVLTVTPAVYRLMKKSPDIVLDTAVGEDMRIRGVIANLDGMEVIKTPASRLPANFGFMVSHKSATTAPLKLQDYRVHQDPPGINGELVEGRVVYDAFVLDNKMKGIYYQQSKVVSEETANAGSKAVK
mgnify:FL=1|jgi:hypothetical protein